MLLDARKIIGKLCGNKKYHTLDVRIIAELVYDIATIANSESSDANSESSDKKKHPIQSQRTGFVDIGSCQRSILDLLAVGSSDQAKICTSLGIKSPTANIALNKLHKKKLISRKKSGKCFIYRVYTNGKRQETFDVRTNMTKRERNSLIYDKFKQGETKAQLAAAFFLDNNTVDHIIKKCKEQSQVVKPVAELSAVS